MEYAKGFFLGIFVVAVLFNAVVFWAKRQSHNDEGKNNGIPDKRAGD